MGWVLTINDNDLKRGRRVTISPLTLRSAGI